MKSTESNDLIYKSITYCGDLYRIYYDQITHEIAEIVFYPLMYTGSRILDEDDYPTEVIEKFKRAL